MRLIDVNARQSAIVKTNADVELSLPAYLGNYAVVEASASGPPDDVCPGIVFLRRTTDGWKVVARTYG
jgi:hypothetical protein